MILKWLSLYNSWWYTVCTQLCISFWSLVHNFYRFLQRFISNTFRMTKFNFHPDTVYSILVIVFYFYLFFCLWLTSSLQFYPWRIERFHWQKYVWYRRLVQKQRRYFFVRYRRVLWRYCQMPNFGEGRKHNRQKKWYSGFQKGKCVPAFRNARIKRILKFQRPNSEQRTKARKWMSFWTIISLL